MYVYWWKRGSMLYESADWNNTGMMDHILKPWAKRAYGGIPGQLTLWIEIPRGRS